MSATVVVTNRYQRDVKRLLSADQRAAMEGFIASAPEAHPVVAGTGGVRKADLTAEDRKAARLFVEAIKH